MVGGSNGDQDYIPTAVDCGPLNITNGAVDTSSGTTFMMTATYTCNTGYNIVGSESRTCGASGVWSPTAPVCEGILIPWPHMIPTVLLLNPSSERWLKICFVCYSCQLWFPKCHYQWSSGHILWNHLHDDCYLHL